MKVIYKNQTKEIKKGDNFVVTEYPLKDRSINAAVIKVNGRYPNKGRIVNLKCKELIYIIKGYGELFVEGKKFELKRGDMVLIDLGERYYWHGRIKAFVSDTPAWYPEQFKIIEE